MAIKHVTCDVKCREEDDDRLNAIETFFDSKEYGQRPEVTISRHIPIMATNKPATYPPENRLDAAFTVSMILIIVVQYKAKGGLWRQKVSILRRRY